MWLIDRNTLIYTLKNVTIYQSNTGNLHLIGNVYNHSIYDDGTQIATSRIIDYSSKDDNVIICRTKSGSLYTFTTEDLKER